MKLTTHQLSVLYELYLDKVWYYNTIKAHKKTLNALLNKNLITYRLKAKGYFWSVTDFGILMIYTMSGMRLSKKVAKSICNLIGCSGLREECLNGDTKCDIVNKFVIKKRKICAQ